MKLYLMLVAMTLTLHVKDKPLNKPAVMTTCTAVMISEDLMLTAAHCATKDTKAGWVKTADGRSYEVLPVYRDPLKDLMLLEFRDSSPVLPYARLGTTPAVTRPVYLVSSEDYMPNTYGSGMVLNYINQGWQHLLVHNAAILHGASGSGLFDGRGQLVGINTMMNSGISYAVSLADIREFLEEYKER